MRIYISALMGVTGETLLAGFIDAFKMPLSETKELLQNIGNTIGQTTVGFSRYTDGLKLEITSEKTPGVSAENMTAAVSKACDDLGLTAGKEFALNVLSSLVDSVARLHNVPREQLVLQDIGNQETVIHIVGMAYIYEKAKLHDADVFCSEIEVGNGKTHFDNQFFYVPMPIVKESLNGLKWRFSTKSGEMVDPVGMALLKNLIKRQEDVAFPNGRVGIGYGSRTFGNVPGRTRVVISQ